MKWKDGLIKMHNKFYKKSKKKEGYYELDVDCFDEFINLLRPDTQIIDFLMTKLRLENEDQEYNSEFDILKNVQVKEKLISDKNIIFRGHGDSIWDLKPTLFRGENNNTYKFDNLFSEHDREYKLLKKFQDSCDLAGVQLPSDGNELRQKQFLKINQYFGRDYSSHSATDWFNDDFFELAAFAQHYGVETRLLDWSKNPFVACYFANSSALRKNYDSNKKISIWVLNYESFPDELDDSLKVLDLPKGINQHISHQQGVLTYIETNMAILVSMISDGGISFEPHSLSKLLEIFNFHHRLLKINLKFDHLPKLYRYCNAHNFNACHLFRGAYGAAIHTKDIINYEKFDFEE